MKFASVWNGSHLHAKPQGRLKTVCGVRIDKRAWSYSGLRFITCGNCQRILKVPITVIDQTKASA